VKFIIYLFLIFSTLNSQEIVASVDSNQVKSKKHSILSALDLYHDQAYQEAYDAFKILFNQDPANNKINFYLGLCAQELQNYDQAIAAFERVLIADPSHIRSRLEMARSLFSVENYDESEKEFLRVLRAGNIPKQVYDNVAKYIVAIESKKIRHRVNVVAMFGLQYDNNINNDIGTSSFLIEPNLVVEEGVTGNTPTGAVVNQEMISVTHGYDFGKIGGWSMQNIVTGFGQNYVDFEEKGVLFTSLSSGFNYKSKNYTLDIAPHLDTLSINKIAFMQVSGLNLKYGRLLSCYGIDTQSEFFSKVEHRELFGLSEKSSHYFELGGLGKWEFDNTNKFKFSYSFAQDRANVPLGNSRDITSVSAELSRPINCDADAKVAYLYKKLSYKGRTLGASGNVTRIDRQQVVKTMVTYRYNPKQIFNANVDFITNYSTINAFAYRKSVVGVSMLLLF
jgi:tetratricopeptide (TPR) repeat protein